MEKFQIELDETNNQIKETEHRYSVIGMLRFVVFLIMAVCLIIGFYDSNIPCLVIGFISVVLFVALVFIHGRINEKLVLLKAKAKVYYRYVARYSDEWKKFPENGKEFLLNNDLVAMDMDLLGSNSLYQFICEAGTSDGRKKLAEEIKSPDYTPEMIVKRQEAVKELVLKDDFSLKFETLSEKAGSSKNSKYSSEEFVKYCNSDEHIPKIFNILRFMFPAITFILLILGIFRVVSLGYALISFFAVLIFSWITSGIAGRSIMSMISFGYILDDYIGMFELVASENFESVLLKSISESLSKDSGALPAVKKLATISAAFNIRYNPIVHQVLCGLFMWDFHLAAMMDRWKEKNGDRIALWIDAISEIEALMSFAVIARTRNVCYPVVTAEQKVHAEATDMYHPLISPDTVVSNDAEFDGGAIIITGSNMSGKTTFLRTLGINLSLAYAGAPVCASQMSADYMKIFTSMRVTDDVSNGISTFYAEILRIKEMVEYKKKGLPMLCLIDEIFKGTNSADRIVGAKSVIEKLSDEYSMTIVSTHDFELCDLKDARGMGAVNYHFEEYYEDDQLKFDYRKKDGRCTTTNAMFILHMAGLD